MIINNGRIQGQSGTMPYYGDEENLIFINDFSFDLMMFECGVDLNPNSTNKEFVKINAKKKEKDDGE